ncbi:TPA: ead/Ea22-like family protein [Escherichia coli]|nr:ead/Ea22-like family protein [Escherichia coli]
MSEIDYQALRERYSPKPVPECSVCGEEMSIQRISGAHVTYACSSYGGDGDFKIGRTLADEHYEKSRVTVVDDSDPDVIALLDELEAAKSKLNEQREYYEGVIADGSKRIAELEKSEEQLINERDHAESALADMYFAATGNRPEWSNWFGFSDAVDAVVDRIADLEAKQPSPVVPDNASESLAYAYKELTPEIMRGHIAVFERYGIAPNDRIITIQALRIALYGIERSNAMLNGDEPVSQAYNLPELIEGMEVSIDVSTCDADLGNRYFGTVTEALELDTAKNGYILLVQDAEPNFDVNGNSPVTPDGWIPVSERMPNDKQYVWCWGKSYGWTECDTFEGYYDWSRNKWWAVTDIGEEPASKVTHWMPLPEPPQEAK